MRTTFVKVICLLAPVGLVLACTEGDPDPCERVACAADEHCELQEVVCITAPCNPVPVCVPDSSPGCAATLCGPGTYCIEREGDPVCVSDGSQACGDVTCSAGRVCCNASCGTCVQPGMACIQIACE